MKHFKTGHFVPEFFMARECWSAVDAPGRTWSQHILQSLDQGH